MYLGPLYYYMMAPALLLANFSPVGPAVMIALLGVATIFFVWYVAREWFGNVAAFISAFLYSIAPVVITYSRSSWNPDIMPFFSLLSIYSIWKVWVKSEFKWLLVLGISFAFVLQSHYLGLLLVPTMGLFWMLSFLKIYHLPSTIYQPLKRNFIKYSLLGSAAFLILMSPLVIFDARHGWRNFSAIKIFFTERQTTVSARPWTSIPKIWPIFRDDYISRIFVGTNLFWGKFAALAAAIVTFLYTLINKSKIIEFLKSEKPKENQSNTFVSGFLIVVVWILFGLLGMGLYKQHVYDHYFGFIFPAIFLLWGGLSQWVYTNFENDGKILVVTSFILLTVFNLIKNPLRYGANHQLKRAVEVAERIKNESGGNRFNLAVIAERNYEDGYQYILEKDGVEIIDIDAQLPGTITDQLFAVCEMPEEKCDPTHNPKAEVANFGWSAVNGKWSVMGVTIYKLIHYK